ncbi:MAG: hypothetical protein AAGG56_17710, partial [Pseudomonadota bacterium]
MDKETLPTILKNVLEAWRYNPYRPEFLIAYSIFISVAWRFVDDVIIRSGIQGTPIKEIISEWLDFIDLFFSHGIGIFVTILFVAWLFFRGINRNVQLNQSRTEALIGKFSEKVSELVSPPISELTRTTARYNEKMDGLFEYLKYDRRLLMINDLNKKISILYHNLELFTKISQDAQRNQFNSRIKDTKRKL